MRKDLETGLEDLQQRLPRVMTAFRELHEATSGEGVLSTRIKRLIMVGISVAIRCEPCIRTHVKMALEQGSSPDEILEAAGVAVLMGGGPSAAYCASYLLEELDGVVPKIHMNTKHGGKP